MRIYQLYLIEDEIASHFFGKEKMFLRLFHEYREAVGEFKQILSKQITYISKPIQGIRIHQFISLNLQRNKNFYMDKGTYCIEIGKKSYAQLEIYENRLILKANGQYDAETVFFEVLRRSESSFLAIDLEHERCGWLKPIKERKFV
jgi:hypothetical protein